MGLTDAARAQTDPTPAYARALQAFNGQLDAAQALVLARQVIHEGDAFGLDARLLVAIIAVESDWHPQAVSSAGAIGLGQLMPATASEAGIDPNDPLANIHGAALHLRALLNHYSAAGAGDRFIYAIAAYNAGAGAVDRYGGVPPYRETQSYVSAVLLLWRRLAGAPQAR